MFHSLGARKRRVPPLNDRPNGTMSPSFSRSSLYSFISSRKGLVGLFQKADSSENRLSPSDAFLQDARPSREPAPPYSPPKLTKRRSKSSMLGSLMSGLAGKMVSATELFHKQDSTSEHKEADLPQSPMSHYTVKGSPRKVRFTSSTYDNSPAHFSPRQAGSSPIKAPKKSGPYLTLDLPNILTMDPAGQPDNDPIPTGRPPAMPVLKDNHFSPLGTATEPESASTGNGRNAFSDIAEGDVFSERRSPLRSVCGTSDGSTVTPDGMEASSILDVTTSQVLLESISLRDMPGAPSPVLLPLPLSIPPKKVVVGSYINERGAQYPAHKEDVWSPLYDILFPSTLLSAISASGMDRVYALLCEEDGFAKFWHKYGLPKHTAPQDFGRPLRDRHDFERLVQQSRKLCGYTLTLNSNVLREFAGSPYIAGTRDCSGMSGLEEVSESDATVSAVDITLD